VQAILVKEDPQNFLLENVDSANSAISIYHEYLTIQYSLSLSLSLSGKTLHKLSQCTLGICYLSLLMGAPEPQHNNIKLVSRL
jgi:hypothetical protein